MCRKFFTSRNCIEILINPSLPVPFYRIEIAMEFQIDNLPGCRPYHDIVFSIGSCKKLMKNYKIQCGNVK